jgi:hypothetical protein
VTAPLKNFFRRLAITAILLLLLTANSCKKEPPETTNPQEISTESKADLRQKPHCLNPYGGIPDYYIGQVASPQIKVYNMPGTYGTILGTMQMGERMRVLSVDISKSPDYWLKIQAGVLVGWVEETGVVVSIPRESFSFEKELLLDIDGDNVAETFKVKGDDFFDPSHQNPPPTHSPENTNIYATIDDGPPLAFATLDSAKGTYRLYDLWREDIDGNGTQEAVLTWGYNPSFHDSYREEMVILTAFTQDGDLPSPIFSIPLRYQKMDTASGEGYDILSEYHFINQVDAPYCQVNVHIRKVSRFFSDTSVPVELYDHHYPLFSFKDLIIPEGSFSRQIIFRWVEELGAYLPELPANNLLDYIYPHTGLSGSLFFSGYGQESKTEGFIGDVAVSPLPGDKKNLHPVRVKGEYTVLYTFFRGNDKWYVVSAPDKRLNDSLIWASPLAQ